MPGYTIKNLMELDDATGSSVPEEVDVGTWDVVRVAPETIRALHSGPA